METALRLLQFPKLVEINILNNPVERDASSLEVLMATFIIKRPELKRFCKEPITD